MARRNLGRLLVLAGLGLLAYSAFQGSLRVGLFFVIPYAYGTGILPFLAFVLLMVGAFLWMTAGFERVSPDSGWTPVGGRAGRDEPRGGDRHDARHDAAQGQGPVYDAPPRGERRVKSGGFVLLGPIPIAWGSGKRLMPWLLAVGIGLFLLFFVLPLMLAR